MNFILRHLLELIVSVVVIFIIVEMLFPGRLVALFTGNPFAGKPSVIVLGEPDISLSLLRSDDEARRYEYKIEFTATVEYSGEMKEFGRDLSKIDVVTVMGIKDKSGKATANDEVFFEVARDERTFTGKFDTNLVSSVPPIREKENPYNGEMDKSDSFLLKSNGNDFKITLLDVKKPYWAYFDIECGDILPPLKLREECEDEKIDECERYVDMCDGVVHIRVDDVNYVTERVYLFIEVSGGKDYEVGEEVEISFWKKSGCVDDENDFDSLWNYCGDLYFLGMQTLKAPLIE